MPSDNRIEALEHAVVALAERVGKIEGTPRVRQHLDDLRRDAERAEHEAIEAQRLDAARAEAAPRRAEALAEFLAERVSFGSGTLQPGHAVKLYGEWAESRGLTGHDIADAAELFAALAARGVVATMRPGPIGADVPTLIGLTVFTDDGARTAHEAAEVAAAERSAADLAERERRQQVDRSVLHSAGLAAFVGSDPS